MSELSSEEAWRRAVLSGLKGAPFEKLVATGAEGIAVEPLYLPKDTAGLVPRGEPGSLPFVRGSRAPGSGPFLVAARVDAHEPVHRIRDELASGTEAIWLTTDAVPNQAMAEEIAAALGESALFLDCGTRALAVQEALSKAGISRLSPLFDPIGSPPDAPGTDAFAGAAGLANAPGSHRALSVNAAAVHEAGGHAALEIGFALASLAETARRLEGHGVSVEKTFAATAIVVTAGTLHLEAIAKLRALRLAYAKLAVALGVPAPPAPFVIGHVSRRAQSRADAPTNFLRATLETFALAVGGADVIVPRVFDDVLEGRSDLGRRVARTTELVLRDESHLAEVADPAGGSYFIEALTEKLARAGWEELRTIEREGGAVASLASGAFAARVLRAKDALLADVRKRKRVLVGTSDFAATGEKLPAAAAELVHGPFSPVRPAAVFEAVRERAAALKSPTAVLVRLGGGDLRAREEFAQRFFETGGLQVRAVEGTDAPGFVGAYPGAVFVLVGTDERYAEVAASVTRALVAAGAPAVALAGKPGALDADLKEAGLTAAAFVGCDAPAVLDDILTAIAGGSR
jgi:methylmalonyl-CoA mutase